MLYLCFFHGQTVALPMNGVSTNGVLRHARTFEFAAGFGMCIIRAKRVQQKLGSLWLLVGERQGR